MRTTLLLFALFVLMFGAASCDQGGPLVVGNIEGPTSVDELGTAQYTVAAKGDTGITYQWACNPASAGWFQNALSATAAFHAGGTIGGTGCTIRVVVSSNKDGPVLRTLDIVVRDTQVPVDPDTPPPFTTVFLENVYDIGIEGDGDIVALTDMGVALFTPFGEFTRTMSTMYLNGVASANGSAFDTGKGIMAIGPMNGGRPTPLYDDPYLPSGVAYDEEHGDGQFGSYDPPWWAGEPDYYNQGEAHPDASASPFQSCDRYPHPIAYQPSDPVYVYQRVFAPECIADEDMDWPQGNVVYEGGWAILASHRAAPEHPDPGDSPVFTGGTDFVVYYDSDLHLKMQEKAIDYGIVPACALHNKGFIWDISNPPPAGDYMSDQPGLTLKNIGDFEFDVLDRLIIALPEAHAVVITEPVVFGEHIVVHQILGSLNGAGALPGEFENPRAVALDPRNQNIVVADTGNGRVQIFDNNGMFIREFGRDFDNFRPGALRVDAFGRILVSNYSPYVWESQRFVVLDEYGAPVTYGAVEGHVYDLGTDEPVGNSRVNLTYDWVETSVMADDEGFFSFVNLPPGDYTLQAEQYSYPEGIEAHVSVTAGYKSFVNVYLTRAKAMAD